MKTLSLAAGALASCIGLANAEVVVENVALESRDVQKSMYIPLKPCYTEYTNGNTYCTPLSAGSPAQGPYLVTVELMTGDLELNGFDCSTSSTCSGDLGSFNLTFDGGATSFSGNYLSDTISLSDTGLSLQNVRFANTTGFSWDSQIWGRLGLGLLSSEGDGTKQYPNVVDSFRAQDQINGYMYSIWSDNLEGSSAHLLLGGVDTTAYNGDLITVNTTSSITSGWSAQAFFDLNEISLTTPSTTSTLSQNTQVDASWSSSTNWLQTDVVKKIWKAMSLPQAGESDVDMFPAIVDCSWQHDTSLTLDLTFGPNVTINVPISELVYQSDTECILDIVASPADQFQRLGFVITRRLYTVYDWTNNQVSFGLNSFAGTGSNVTEIPATGITTLTSTIPSPTPTPTPPKPSIIPIAVGAGVGGPVVLIILATILFCCYKRRQKRRNAAQQSEPYVAQGQQMDTAQYNYQGTMPGSPVPQYTSGPPGFYQADNKGFSASNGPGEFGKSGMVPYATHITEAHELESPSR